MWVRMTEPVVAGRKPRIVGNVLDLPRAEARELIRIGCAVECEPTPSPRDEPDGVETADNPPAAEQAVSRKKGAK